MAGPVGHARKTLPGLCLRRGRCAATGTRTLGLSDAGQHLQASQMRASTCRPTLPMPVSDTPKSRTCAHAPSSTYSQARCVAHTRTGKPPRTQVHNHSRHAQRAHSHSRARNAPTMRTHARTHMTWGSHEVCPRRVEGGKQVQTDTDTDADTGTDTDRDAHTCADPQARTHRHTSQPQTLTGTRSHADAGTHAPVGTPRAHHSLRVSGAVGSVGVPKKLFV